MINHGFDIHTDKIKFKEDIEEPPILDNEGRVLSSDGEDDPLHHRKEYKKDLTIDEEPT